MSVTLKRLKFIYRLMVIYLMYMPAAGILYLASFLAGGVDAAKEVWDDVKLPEVFDLTKLKEEWKKLG